MANNNHFSLVLDTTAPTGSIERPAATGGYAGIINADGDMAITKTDTPTGGEVTLMKIWYNTNAIGTKEDTGYTGGTWEAAVTTYKTKFGTAPKADPGTYYYHLVLRDDVGNESVVYNTESIMYDPTRPTISNLQVQDPDSGSSTITNNVSGNRLIFNYADNLSGVIKGGVQDSDDVVDFEFSLDPTQSSHNATHSQIFSEGTLDGLKNIKVWVLDKAGNYSEYATTSITLDTTLDKPVLSLKKADGTSALPTYINYLGIKANLVGNDTNIVAYKIWEGSVEPEYTAVTEGSLDVTIALTLENSDGVHTIHAKVKDAAGNEKAADDKTVTVDRALPTASISRTGAEWISNISGFTSSEIKFTCADALSGVAEYEVYCNSTKISEGEQAETDKTITITSATSGMVEGSNTFTVVVKDKAGNVYTMPASSGAVIKLDTTIPTVKLPSLSTWYNATFDVSGISGADVGAGLDKMYVWSDTVAVPAIPTIAASDWINYATSVTKANIHWGLAQSANNYLHIVVKDRVGNMSVMTEAIGSNEPNKVFGYDNVAPTKPSVAWSASVYTSTTASITLTYSDATSGVAKFQMSGDITESSESTWLDIVGTKSVTLTTGDGNKSIKIRTKDNAENVSEWSELATCELDTSTPSGTLNLYERGTSTTKASPSNIATADAYITYSDDAIGKGYYKIWGNFHYYDESKTDKRGAALAATEAAAEWIEITPEAGVKAFTVNLICTTGDGQKNVSVRLKDNAGHEFPVSPAAALTQNFVFDTTAPEVVVSNPDYNRISKADVVRYDGTTALTTKCNEVKFSFHIGEGEVFQAYKVVAYADATAAAKGSHADAAIPTAGGSTNMSASGISQTGTVSCMLRGADYESALNGGQGPVETHAFDGSHIVVVYVQDAGGTWSVAASFNA